jgi:hypothetical protein
MTHLSACGFHFGPVVTFVLPVDSKQKVPFCLLRCYIEAVGITPYP